MKKQQAEYKANLIGERDLSKSTKGELKLSVATFMSGLAMHYYHVKGYSKRAKRIRQALPNFDFFGKYAAISEISNRREHQTDNFSILGTRRSGRATCPPPF